MISKKALKECWKKHPETEQALKAWYREMCLGKWSNPNQLKLDFPSASILGERRVIFNIKGNDYRLILAIAYRLGVVYIKFVGTHKQYDVINASTIDMN